MLGSLWFGGQGLVVHRPLTSPRAEEEFNAAEEFNGMCIAVFKAFLGCVTGTSGRARDSGSRRIPRLMTRYPQVILGCSRHTPRSQPVRRVALSIVNLHRAVIWS